jgi:O-acetyl-ADP-ribose deacetylase (regulator of RNase III)
MKIEHIKNDLFISTDSLAHCVSQDLNMGAGIAKIFKKTFGLQKELQNKNKQIGEVAIVKQTVGLHHRYIYYLITKQRYFHKPTYKTLTASLINMRTHIIKRDIPTLSIPRIGCGLDKLNWEKVESILEEVFKDIDIIISVYSL